jgi:hypothetical protein
MEAVDTLSKQRAGVMPAAANTSESSTSAVSWPAIFAGAFVASAASLILVGLGSGFGLASVSAWPNSGASATTFTVMTAIWLIVVQWVASGLGGYLAGRLRTKWVGTHTHEVFFRDTAHGFITWSVATIVIAVFLASATSSIIGGGFHAAATAASGASQAAAASAAQAGASGAQMGSAVAPYDVDMLFRSARQDSSATTAEARAEAARILANGIVEGDVPAADRTYLAELVAARTGLSPEGAQKRVDSVIAQAKAGELKVRQAADTVRKAGAEASLFTALAMLVVAFIACISAALGGHRRDEHV